MPSLEALIALYGPAAIFAGTFMEGETIVVVAGFLAHQGNIDPAIVALSAFLGSFGGDQLWFYLGRRYSSHFLIQRMTTRPIFKKALAMIEDHPRKFIMSFRFVYGIRNVSPVAIGLSSVPSRQYLKYNALAAAVWAVSFTVMGYAFGTTIQAFFGDVHAIEQKILVGAGIALAVYVAFRLGSMAWRWTADRRKPS